MERQKGKMSVPDNKETGTEKEPRAEKEEAKAKEPEVKYEKLGDLPETLRTTLPERAQHIYLEAYKEAWDNYTEAQGGEAGREAVAHRDAMTAVQKEYVHDSESGKWRRRGEGADTEREKGIIESIKEML
jgi:cation transport regulator